jgi:EmrB/QacA subfamily drug resistance transporter
MATATFPAAQSFSELPKRTRNFVVAGVMLGLLLGALDQTIVGTAMPRIIATLGGLDRYAWVITAYLVTSTISVPIVGKLGDQFGRKWFYVIGIVIFLLGSALAGASGEWGDLPLIGGGMNQLVLWRGLQGLGAGIMQANSFAIIGDIFPPAQRGKVQGLFGAVFGISSVIGPTVGGYITDNLDWRWVFYINLPVGAVALAVLISTMPVIRASHIAQKIDYLGAAALTACLVPLLLAFTWAGQQYAWSSPQVITAFSVAAVMAVLFCLIESRAAAPILPLDLFTNRIFTISCLVVFATGFGMFGTILFIPLFIQGVIGTTATQSGQILTPMMVGLIVSSVIGGQIISRTGRYRLPAIVGLIVMTFGMFLLSREDIHTTSLLAVRNMVVIGLGLGVTMPVFTIAVQNSAPFNRLGVVTSGIQFFRSIGGTVGAAVMGSFLNSRLTSALAANVSPQLRQALAQGPNHGQINAQALISPAATQAMQASFAKVPGGVQLFGQFLTALKLSLSSAIQQVFTIGFFVVAAAAVICFFLPEIPLRRTHQPVAGEPEPGIGADGQTQRAQPAAVPALALRRPATTTAQLQRDLLPLATVILAEVAARGHTNGAAQAVSEGEPTPASLPVATRA